MRPQEQTAGQVRRYVRTRGQRYLDAAYYRALEKQGLAPDPYEVPAELKCATAEEREEHLAPKRPKREPVPVLAFTFEPRK